MFKTKDMSSVIGQTCGIYTILYECDHKSTDGHRLFHVKCNQCGFETDMQFRYINRAKECNHIKAFGTYINPKIRWKNQRIREIFAGMIQRCYNSTNKNYCLYGAKGIQICQEWIDNPLKFEEWSLLNGYADNLTIDRIDSSKDYSPKNCRWITNSENSRRANAHYLEINGVSLSGKQWAFECGFGCNIINSLLRKNPEEKVKELIEKRLQDPTKTRKSHQTWFNVYGIK